MNPAARSLLWYLLAGTRGGPNRIRILEELHDRPHNANQLAAELDMDYRTVRHHLRLLESNGLIVRPVGRAYASPYELSFDLSLHFEEIAAVREGVARGRHRPARPTSPGSGRLTL